MNNVSLFELTKEQVEIAHLIEESEELDEIDLAILQINEAQFVEKAANYVSVISHYAGEVARFKELKNQVDVAIKRKQRVIDQLTERLESAIQIVGPKEVGIYKLSTRKSDAVIVEDPNLIPDEFKTRKVVETINKNAIKAALKKDEEVPGARLQINQNLQIK